MPSEAQKPLGETIDEKLELLIQEFPEEAKLIREFAGKVKAILNEKIAPGSKPSSTAVGAVCNDIDTELSAELHRFSDALRAKVQQFRKDIKMDILRGRVGWKAEAAEAGNKPGLSPEPSLLVVRYKEIALLTVDSLYKEQYDSLPDAIKTRCSWKTLRERLLANGVEKLKKTEAMQGKGELFGVDKEGRALFRDKGVEPVMYGFDDKDKLMQIYDRDPEQMKQVKKWANYLEVHEQVHKDGYELFKFDVLVHDVGFGDEMKQAEKHTKKPFVASKNKKEWRTSWLESGNRPVDPRTPPFGVLYAGFHPVWWGCFCRLFHLDSGWVGVHIGPPQCRGSNCGVVRLLRV